MPRQPAGVEPAPANEDPGPAGGEQRLRAEDEAASERVVRLEDLLPAPAATAVRANPEAGAGQTESSRPAPVPPEQSPLAEAPQPVPAAARQPHIPEKRTAPPRARAAGQPAEAAPGPEPAPLTVREAPASEVPAPVAEPEVPAEAGQTAAPRATERTLLARWLPLAGGAAALAIGWWAEMLAEARNTSQWPLVLYLLAIVLFWASAWSLYRAPGGQVQDFQGSHEGFRFAGPFRRVRAWQVLGAGVVVAVALNGWMLLLLRSDLHSAPAVWLWLGSVAVLLGTAVVLHRWGTWRARWNGLPPSLGRRQIWALAAAILSILAVATAARLLRLDAIPLGINADEGDRGATAIQIARGVGNFSIFDVGWYYISNVYFWLLAQVMNVAGISYVGARVFGALAGIASVGIVTWIGVRHFSVRVGLMAGALLAVMAVALQFSRETSEAGPTATLWAASVALLLEAARTGRVWAWVGSGIAGGLSLYFYPSGRLWGVQAVLAVAYLFLNGLGRRRAEIVRGAILAALAAFLVMSPFLYRTFAMGNSDLFWQRANQTSIFTADNPTRLAYYDPKWSTPELLVQQTIRSVGIVNQFKDEGGFWPTDKPITSGLLALLLLLGLGWCALRWSHPPSVILMLWFATGILGAVVTVETPNLQRMATAIPVMALFPALALDSLASRVEQAVRGLRSGKAAARSPRRPFAWAIPAALALVTLWLVANQSQAYFVSYAAVDRWPQPTGLGNAVKAQGDAWVFTLGRQYHMVNAGWVRLLAPNTPRGGVRSPGGNLPLALPADRDMVFLYYPKQDYYLPYLQSLYPGGTVTQYTHPTEGLMFSTYRVPKDTWAARQGALAVPSGGARARVASLGEAPAGLATYPAAVQWKALLRVPRYWNYALRITVGRLEIDGRPVADAGASSGKPVEGVVSLAQGEHSLLFEATLQSGDGGQAPRVEWAELPQDYSGGPAEQPGATLDWKPIPTEMLAPVDRPTGLYGEVSRDGQITQRRIDPALAACCLRDEVAPGGTAFDIAWRGSLTVSASNTYTMSIFTDSPLTLSLDGKTVLDVSDHLGEFHDGSVSLSSGQHLVEIHYKGSQGANGAIEWTWAAPGSPPSIVPPEVLAPPAGAGAGAPLSPDDLDAERTLPVLNPVETVP